MKKLADYVRAIQGMHSDAVILRNVNSRETIEDPSGNEVFEQATYWFADGAVIQRETETYDGETQPGTCMPCLVYYGVLTDADTDIHPKYKQFDNQCQAWFWALLNT
jgi:hypothetical protein